MKYIYWWLRYFSIVVKVNYFLKLDVKLWYVLCLMFERKLDIKIYE